MRNLKIRLLVLLLCSIFSTPALSDDVASELAAATAELATSTFQLKYDFAEGEVIRYRVEHLATVDTKISGNKQVTKSTSKSTKAWKVESVEGQNITFVHMIEDAQMWQQVDGRDEVRYDSKSETPPPSEYEHVSKSIGKTVATVTIDQSGAVIARKSDSKTPDLGFGGLVVPLPKEPVELLHSWTVPKTMRLRDKDGRIKEVKTQMRYRLEKVETGIATISVKTEVLTPVNDATLKSQLVQQISNGVVKFDIDAGRVLSKQLDWTENVIGFNGPGSNMKYLARFTETLVEPQTASRQVKSEAR